MIDIYQIFTEQKNIEIIAHVSSELKSKVISDKKRIVQVMVQLLSNALKFLSEGKVIISAALPPEPDPGDGSQIQISVKDNGTGISDQQLEILRDILKFKTR